MKWLTSLFCACCLVVTATAQDIEIKGLVLGLEGEGVPFANVTAEKISSEAEKFAYAITDVDGKFNLKLDPGKATVKISVSAMGYAEKTIVYEEFTGEKIEIELDPNTTILKTIMVKAKKKIGDTLSVSLDEMNLGENDNLEKILERTAGVILGEDGKISYRGKQINKIMINGKEVFVSQNKTALENLTYEIMESVQVIDNHKGKFELNFDRVRDPVININTKNEFKGVLKAELAGGYGHRNRYEGKAKGFFFSDKFNSFATGQVNNYGGKVFSSNDLTEAYDGMTSAAENQLLPFLALNEQARKNIFNGNDFVFRTESERSKTGLQVGAGWLNLETRLKKNTFLSDTLIRSAEHVNKQIGNYLSAALDHTVKVTPNLVLSNKTNLVRTKLTNNIFSQDSIFLPTRISFSEITDQNPASFVIQNNTRLSKIISGDWVLGIRVNLYHEEVEDVLSSKMLSASSNVTNQTIASDKNEASLVSEVQRSFKNSSLAIGYNVSLGREDADSNFPQEDFSDDTVSRRFVRYGLKGVYEGTVGKLDYSFAAAPTLIRFNGNKSDYIFQTSNRLTYRIQQQNFLDLSFVRSFDFQQIDKLLSLTANSINSIVVNETPGMTNLVANNQLSLGWSNRNLARSRVYSINYLYNQVNNSIQTFFDRIEDTRSIYTTRQIESSSLHFLSLEVEKGFYTGKKMNKLDFIFDLDINTIRYPSVINLSETIADVVSVEPSFKLRYSPRKVYIREINNKIQHNRQKFYIDGDPAGFQNSIINTLSVRGGRKKTSFDFNFTIEKYFLDQENFSVADMNFTTSYALTDDFSLSLNANRLLTLFKLNNFNSVRTFSNGNLVIQSFNSDNLSYLILNASCKL